jgi:hypothetical protein
MKGCGQRQVVHSRSRVVPRSFSKPPSLGEGMEAFLFEIAENAFQQRTRLRASLRRTLRVRLSRLASRGLAGKTF